MAKESPGFEIIIPAELAETPEVYDGSAAPKGVYKITHKESFTGERGGEKKGGCTWCRHVFEVVEGPNTGSTISIFTDLPDSNDPDPVKRAAFNAKAVGRFKGLLVRLGTDKGKLDAKLAQAKAEKKPLAMGVKNLQGKFGYVDFQPKSEDLGIEYDRVTWLRDEAAYKAKLTQVSGGGGNGHGHVDEGVEVDEGSSASGKGGATQRKGGKAQGGGKSEKKPEVTAEAAPAAASEETDDFSDIV